MSLEKEIKKIFWQLIDENREEVINRLQISNQPDKYFSLAQIQNKTGIANTESRRLVQKYNIKPLKVGAKHGKSTYKVQDIIDAQIADNEYQTEVKNFFNNYQSEKKEGRLIDYCKNKKYSWR